MTSRTPNLKSVQGDIGEKVRLLLKLRFGGVVTGHLREIILQERVKITRTGLQWSVYLLIGSSWCTVAFKPSGTGRSYATGGAPYEWQLAALEVMRQALILDELADV